MINVSPFDVDGGLYDINHDHCSMGITSNSEDEKVSHIQDINFQDFVAHLAAEGTSTSRALQNFISSTRCLSMKEDLNYGYEDYDQVGHHLDAWAWAIGAPPLCPGLGSVSSGTCMGLSLLLTRAFGAFAGERG